MTSPGPSLYIAAHPRIHIAPMSWVAVTTIGATENDVADRLKDAGLEVFYPYIREKRRVPLRAGGYKVVTVEEARWPRYLFVNVENDESLALVLSTKDVRGVVRSSEGAPSIVPDNAMDALRKSCMQDGRVTKKFVPADVLNFFRPDSLAA